MIFLTMLELYNKRLGEVSSEIYSISRVLKKLSLIRLLLFLSVFVLLFQLSKFSLFTSIVVFVVFFLLFLLLVLKYNNLEKEKEKRTNLLKILKNELETSVNKSNLFGNGEEFADYFHPYTTDLDIFGKFSVFNRINRSVTYEGKEMLSKWLRGQELDICTIKYKQSSISELAKNNELREEFLLCFFTGSNLTEENKGILKWINNFPDQSLFHKYLKTGLILFTLVLIFLAALSFVVEWVFPVLIFGLVISFIINIGFKKRIDILHNHASRHSELFLKYAEIMELIKKQSFEQEILKQIKQNLTGSNKFRLELLKISSIIKKLDYRLNIFVGPVLNILFFWDIHYVFELKSWIDRNKGEFDIWLHDIGIFDAMMSLSIIKFNNPDWVFPTIRPKVEVSIEVKDLGHVLIKDCITNNYSLVGKSKFDIVTGSNMAGKSTFLRSLGVNLVLGMAGSVVKASYFDFSPLKIFTYMRISDSIELELSTFHAELEKIKRILEYVGQNEKTFLLLDELLRGTNTIDRQTGSMALIKQLIKKGASGIIATHDLNLTQLEKILPEKIKNYNFCIQSSDEELFFDYKLNPGVCNTFNAALLMKKIGIEISEQ